jgi:hypothetical protein
MVTNLAKEVTDLKNDNTLLKQEIKALHSLIEASPRPTFQHITREQHILPAEMSNNEAASIQPSAALPNLALPISVPAGMTLSYRDVAAIGIPPSEPTVPLLMELQLLPRLNLADSRLLGFATLHPCLLL